MFSSLRFYQKQIGFSLPLQLAQNRGMRAHNGKFLYKIIAIQKKALLVPSGDSQLGLNGPLSEKKSCRVRGGTI